MISYLGISFISYPSWLMVPGDVNGSVLELNGVCCHADNSEAEL